MTLGFTKICCHWKCHAIALFIVNLRRPANNEAGFVGHICLAQSDNMYM